MKTSTWPGQVSHHKDFPVLASEHEPPGRARWAPGWVGTWKGNLPWTGKSKKVLQQIKGQWGMQGLVGEEKGEVGNAKFSDRLKASGSGYGRNGRT